MTVDLHNWDTIEELMKAEYDANHLGFVVMQEMGETFCGAVYHRTNSRKVLLADDMLYSTIEGLQPMLMQERRKLFMPCARKLVRDHVRPCV